MHIGPLGFGGFAEFLARHGGAVNSVAAGFRADINHWIAFAGRARVKNLIVSNKAQSKRIHQRIAGVAGLEFRFAAQIGDAETVTVGGNPTDHAFEDGMILVNLLSRCRRGRLDRAGVSQRRRSLHTHRNGTKPQ